MAKAPVKRVARTRAEYLSFDYPGRGACKPEDLPVMPKRWVWQDDKRRGWTLAVAMPYPATDSAQCVNREDLYLRDQPGAGPVQEMREICGRCPIKKACLGWALAHEEFGFWAGMTADERKVERKRIGLRMVDPTNLHIVNLNEKWDSPVKTHCSNGHRLRADVDFVRAAQPVDDPYRHVYHVQCSTCYYNRYESDAAKARYKELGRVANEALVRKGKRNTSKRNLWGGA